MAAAAAGWRDQVIGQHSSVGPAAVLAIGMGGSENGSEPGLSTHDMGLTDQGLLVS